MQTLDHCRGWEPQPHSCLQPHLQGARGWGVDAGRGPGACLGFHGTGLRITTSSSNCARKLREELPLVVQWLRICLTVEGTRVWSLVQEDSTFHGTTKPCATARHMPRARAPWQEKPLQWETLAPQLERSPCSLQLQKAHAQQWRGPQN